MNAKIAVTFILTFTAPLYAQEPFVYSLTDEAETDNALVGAKTLPSDSQWESAKVGMPASEIAAIFDKITQRMTHADGTYEWIIWKYDTSKPISERSVPAGPTYWLYFDANSRLIKKETRVVSDEESKRLYDARRKELFEK